MGFAVLDHPFSNSHGYPFPTGYGPLSNDRFLPLLETFSKTGGASSPLYLPLILILPSRDLAGLTPRVVLQPVQFSHFECGVRVQLRHLSSVQALP
jgi:hypothetical protein